MANHYFLYIFINGVTKIYQQSYSIGTYKNITVFYIIFKSLIYKERHESLYTVNDVHTIQIHNGQIKVSIVQG